jgi:hypothetical protein
LFDRKVLYKLKYIGIEREIIMKARQESCSQPSRDWSLARAELNFQSKMKRKLLFVIYFKLFIVYLNYGQIVVNPMYTIGGNINLPLYFSADSTAGMLPTGLGFVPKVKLLTINNKVSVGLRLDEYLGYDFLGKGNWVIGLSPKIEVETLFKYSKNKKWGLNISAGKDWFSLSGVKEKLILSNGNAIRLTFTPPFSSTLDTLYTNVSNEFFFQYSQFNNSYQGFILGVGFCITYRKFNLHKGGKNNKNGEYIFK